jgi:GNAT superfamily N-acetyltransferase
MFHSLRRRGLLYTLGILFNRIVPSKLFRFRVFRVFQLQSPAGISPTDAPFDFHWCESEADVQQAKAATYFDTSDAANMQRYEACLAYEGTGRDCVGGVWRARDWFIEDDLGLRIHLEPDQAWIFAAYVAKDQRGRGVYASLLSHVLRTKTAQTHFASINPTNQASMAAHRKFIRSTLGTCFALRILGLAICWCSGGLQQDKWLSFGCVKEPISIRLN